MGRESRGAAFFFLRLSQLLLLLAFELLHLFELLDRFLINGHIDFPLDLFRVPFKHPFERFPVTEGRQRLVDDDHNDLAELPNPNQGAQIGLHLSHHFEVEVGVACNGENLFGGTELYSDEFLELRVDRCKVLERLPSYLGVHAHKSQLNKEIIMLEFTYI